MELMQVKSSLLSWMQELIDVWFPSGNLINDLAKPAITTVLENNADKIDGILNVFADKEGNINLDKLLDRYMELIPDEGLPMDLSNVIGKNIVSDTLKKKVLEKSDLEKLKQSLSNGISQTFK